MELNHYDIGMLATISNLREHAAKLEREYYEKNNPGISGNTLSHEQVVDYNGTSYVLTSILEPSEQYHQRLKERRKTYWEAP